MNTSEDIEKEIQKSLCNWSLFSHKRKIIIKKGTYVVTKPIYIPDNVTLEFEK